MESKEKTDAETLTSGLKDPSNWKAGMIYYNCSDKRFFLPRKVGFGWTINFANPYAYVALLNLMVLVIAIVKYV